MWIICRLSTVHRLSPEGEIAGQSVEDTIDSDLDLDLDLGLAAWDEVIARHVSRTSQLEWRGFMQI